MQLVPTKPLARLEFITLMACLVALEALSIDAMLPALSQIGNDLDIAHANDRQLIITSIFLGVSLGIMGYGIAGDSLGRKRPIYLGLIIFILGTVLCSFSENFSVMLAGRVLQGFGAAGPYVLSTALIRDMYKGRQMAEVMSLILMIFIIVPAVAPLMGQAILLVSSWRSIFIALGVFAVIVGLWFCVRQPETLPIEKRVPLSWKQSIGGIKEVLQSKKVLSFILAEGFIFAAFVGFLSTSQQVFQEQYQLGEKFPLYFASLVIFLGLAAFLNSRLVVKLGMYALASRSLLAVAVSSALFLAYEFLQGDGSPLWVFTIYMMLIYFCIGLVFGNIKSMAMESMGHIAGIASAVIGSMSTIIAAVIGGFIGSFYNDSVFPIVAGFMILSIAAKWLVHIGETSSETNSVNLETTS